MDIDIQTPNFAPQQPLLDFVRERVDKLAHFDKHIEKAAVWLRLNKADDGVNKQCEIRLTAHGKDFFASNQYETFEEAAVRSLEAVKQQLKHFKDKLQS